MADFTLIRKPAGSAAGKEHDVCSYAFFPGCTLAGSEPEIVIKIYDSILFQHPDTAIFLQCCGEQGCCGDVPDGTSDSICESWEALGKPVMITACPDCCRRFRESLPQIPVISLYEFLQQLNINGGCNSTDYTIIYPESAEGDETTLSAVRELAEDMGVTLHDDDGLSYPYMTCCMKQRNTLKLQGHDAVHILELIFGMGESNAHLEHEHEHEHDHDDEHVHSKCAPNEAASAPLPDEKQQAANRLELKQLLLSFFWNE